MTHQRSLRARILQATFALLVLGGGIATQTGVAYAAGKVSPAPASTNVIEGQSFDVTFVLDAPIISPMGSLDPNVTLSFTPDDPSRLSFSPSTIQWTPSQWFQPRTLQVTAIADGIHDASNTDVVHVTTTSGAAYYTGYMTSFTAVITDLDPAPTTTTTPPPPLQPTTTTTTIIVPPPTAPSTSTSTTDAVTTTTSTATTTEIAVSPATGTLPATGAPIGSRLMGGVVFLAAGLALVRPNRARARR